MGAELYREDPVYRDAIDRCAAILRPVTGQDIRTALFEHAEPGSPEALLALVVTEYALATTLIEAGVVPDALIGHSLGEYTAACLAGTLDLAEMLPVVAERMRFIVSSGGATVGIAASADEVRPLLDGLGALAKELDMAVVLISHMSKPGPGVASALDRLLGSSDFRNAARSILIVGRDPDHPDTRVVAHAKNSLGMPGESQQYHICENGTVAYDGPCSLTADRIIRETGEGQPRTREGAAHALHRAVPRGRGVGRLEHRARGDDRPVRVVQVQRRSDDPGEQGGHGHARCRGKQMCGEGG